MAGGFPEGRHIVRDWRLYALLAIAVGFVVDAGVFMHGVFTHDLDLEQDATLASIPLVGLTALFFYQQSRN